MTPRTKLRAIRRFLVGALVCLPVMGVTTLAHLALARSQQPPPDSVGACGFGDTCRRGGCHAIAGSTTLNWEMIQEAPVPGPLPPAYVPGDTYQFRLQVTDTDPFVVRIGMEIAALMGCPVWETAGMIMPVNPNRSVISLGERDVEFLSHLCTCQALQDPACCGYLPEGAPGENGWSFFWTAPPRGSGEVRFYFSINAANGDMTSQGDRIVPGEVFLPEEACDPPVIRDLRARRTDCDPAEPGVRKVELSWAQTDPGDVVRFALGPAELLQERISWADAGGDCLPIDTGSELTFYSVGRICELGSEAH